MCNDGTIFIKNEPSEFSRLIQAASSNLGFGVCLGILQYKKDIVLLAWSDGMTCAIHPSGDGIRVNFEVPEDDFQRMWSEGVEPNA